MKRARLKRKKGLEPGKPLGADPEKVREFIQRGRATSLSRSDALRQGRTAPKASRGSDRPVAPREDQVAPWRWRCTVLLLDHGLCVMCGAGPFFADQDRWTWQAHHPVHKQILPEERKWDPRNGVVLCRRCHERHETWTARIPREKLPARCMEFATELGAAVVSVLERAHPTDGGSTDGEG